MLNFSDEAVEVMNNQNSNNISCFIATKKSIYDGLASHFRHACTSIATGKMCLVQAMGTPVEDNDGAMPTKWIQEFIDESFYALPPAKLKLRRTLVSPIPMAPLSLEVSKGLNNLQKKKNLYRNQLIPCSIHSS